MAIKRRLKRIENKLNPPQYARIEHVLRVLDLEKKEVRTVKEERLLTELQSVPPHPDLVKALEKLDSKCRPA